MSLGKLFVYGAVAYYGYTRFVKPAPAPSIPGGLPSPTGALALQHPLAGAPQSFLPMKGLSSIISAFTANDANTAPAVPRF